MKNNYEEYKKKEKLKEQYQEEEIIINEDGIFFKIVFFIFDIMCKIFNLLYYIGLIILCSVGATLIANKIGIINIF